VTYRCIAHRRLLFVVHVLLIQEEFYIRYTNIYVDHKAHVRMINGSFIPDSRQHKSPTNCELGIAQLVGFFVMESVHPDSSPRLDTSARIFLDLFQDLTTLFFSVVGDVPVDSEINVLFINLEIYRSNSVLRRCS
jgi:hypothetical protein